MIKTLSDQERLDWLRLYRCDRIGPITFYQLMRHYGSAAAALEALPGLGKNGGAKSLRITSVSDAKREIDATHRFGARMIASCEPDYPRLLAQLEDSPPIIIVKGHIHLASLPCIGIVGARNASLNGRNMAEKLGNDLAEYGWTVVSGLARGIDAAAHRGALKCANGATIGVIAGGIDTIYPQEHEALQNEVSERGLLLTEVPMKLQPLARHFPRRNRLISGLSMGIVVIEAALKSGSLITARYAADQGREVFSVPGSPLDPRSMGTNSLIKDGAILTASVDDIVNAFTPMVRNLNDSQSSPLLSTVNQPIAIEKPLEATTDRDLPIAREIIYNLLSPSPVDIDRLVEESHYTFSTVSHILLELELAGKLERQLGNRVALIVLPN